MRLFVVSVVAGVVGGVVGAWVVVGGRGPVGAVGGVDPEAAERVAARIDALEAEVASLREELGRGAASLAAVEGPAARDVAGLEARIEELEARNRLEVDSASARADGGRTPEAGIEAPRLDPARSAFEVILDSSATDAQKLAAHRSLRRVEDAYSPALIDALVDLGRTSPDPDIRASTWTMFDGASHLPELVPSLMDAAMHDMSPAARREAAETLGNYVDDPAVRQLLEQLARDDPSKEVRDRAKRTLRDDG